MGRSNQPLRRLLSGLGAQTPVICLTKSQAIGFWPVILKGKRFANRCDVTVPQQGEKRRQCGALASIFNEVEVQKNKHAEHKPLSIEYYS
jgi:hypothetical protein